MIHASKICIKFIAPNLGLSAEVACNAEQISEAKVFRLFSFVSVLLVIKVIRLSYCSSALVLEI